MLSWSIKTTLCTGRSVCISVHMNLQYIHMVRNLPPKKHTLWPKDNLGKAQHYNLSLFQYLPPPTPHTYTFNSLSTTLPNTIAPVHRSSFNVLPPHVTLIVCRHIIEEAMNFLSPSFVQCHTLPTYNLQQASTHTNTNKFTCTLTVNLVAVALVH